MFLNVVGTICQRALTLILKNSLFAHLSLGFPVLSTQQTYTWAKLHICQYLLIIFPSLSSCHLLWDPRKRQRCGDTLSFSIRLLFWVNAPSLSSWDRLILYVGMDRIYGIYRRLIEKPCQWRAGATSIWVNSVDARGNLSQMLLPCGH